MTLPLWPMTLLFLTLLMGCRATLTPQVRGKPLPERVVLLPTLCVSVENVCPKKIEDKVTSVVASELELEGYTVIDARKLISDARVLEGETQSALLFDPGLWPATGKRHQGTSSERLTLEQQQTLTERGHAKGLVSVRLDIGKTDEFGRRTNAVEIRMDKIAEPNDAWVSQCTGRSGLSPNLPRSIAGITLCALGGVVSSKRTQNVHF